MLKNDQAVNIYKVLVMKNKDANPIRVTAHEFWSLNAGKQLSRESVLRWVSCFETGI